MYHFIVNNTSGGGRSKRVWEELQNYLLEHEIRYKAHFTEYEGHAKKLADRVCDIDREKVYLIVVGGDGTLNEVLNGMHDFEKIRFGYIPTGSGNDFARGMKINGTPTENLERILQAEETTPIDLGCVSWVEEGQKEQKIFAISSGLGLDADVCKQALHSGLKKALNKLGLGSLTYVCLTIKSLFTMPTTEAKIVFDDEVEEPISRMIFIAGMNQYCEGGGVPMAPDAVATDGEFSVCCAYGVARWCTFFLLPFLVKGKHTGFKCFDIHNCRKFSVDLEKPMVLHADGEYCGDVTHAEFRCLSGKLNILL